MPNSDRFGRNHALLSGPGRQWLAAGQPRFVGPQGFDDFYEDYFAGTQAPPAEPRGRTIGQMAALLWRRKYLVLGVMLVCGLVAYTVSYLVTPRYTAEGVLAVQNQPLYFAQLGTPNPPNAMDPSIPRSEAQILNSRSLLEKTARQLRLDRDPDLNPFLTEAPFFTRMINEAKQGFVDMLMAVGIVEQPKFGNVSKDDHIWSAVVDNMHRHLDVHTDGKSYVIYVGYSGTEPKESSEVVNALMKNFQTAQIESYNASLESASDWIKQRAAELRKEVEGADQKVADYRSKHSLVETKRDGTVSEQQLAEINTQLSLAQADHTQAEARLSQAQEEAKHPSAIGTSASEVLSSELIQKLRGDQATLLGKRADLATHLGPNHPLLKAVNSQIASLDNQINRETQKILRSLQDQAVITETRVQTLQKQLTSLQARATKVSDYQVVLNQLQKEADTKRNVYETFLATAQSAADPSRVNQANTRIVSTASAPPDPTSPKRSIFALAGMFVGFLASGAASVLLAEMDHGFETVSEVEGALGLPVLGSLPFIRRRSPRRYGLGQELIDGPHSAVSETLRGVRVALKSYSERGLSQVVLVTSAEPAEGKTSFASAMAAIAARDGLRVLIVDSDLRRPRFHRMFQAEPGPALQDVLRGSKDWSEAVRSDPHSGAHCLTAHERTDSPVALLSSGHWEAFLSEARKIYDLIILDSPPVIQVADALTLADYADTTLFVVAYKSTPKQLVQEAIHRFAATRKSVTGVVLSKVPGTQVAQSYYSGYYAA